MKHKELKIKYTSLRYHGGTRQITCVFVQEERRIFNDTHRERERWSRRDQHEIRARIGRSGWGKRMIKPWGCKSRDELKRKSNRNAIEYYYYFSSSVKKQGHAQLTEDGIMVSPPSPTPHNWTGCDSDLIKPYYKWLSSIIGTVRLAILPRRVHSHPYMVLLAV